MNKKLPVFLMMLTVLCGTWSFAVAQDTLSTQPVKPSPTRSLNVVKLNLTSLASLKINTQIERALGNKVSFALEGNVIPGKSLPKFLTNSDPTNTMSTFKTFSWAVTPELRWYPGSKKGAPNGFYIAPYGRYRHSSMTCDVQYSYPDANNKTVTERVQMEGKFSGFGLGLLFGSQWIIGKHISLDWFIAGGHAGPGKVTFQSSLPNISVNAQEDLRNQINDISLPFMNNVDAEVTSDLVKISTRFPLVGIRAAGLSLGFAF